MNLQESLESIAKGFVKIQDQLDSSTRVVLQNQRGLGLLTAEKGSLCFSLGEECCFYLYQSGLIRDAAPKLTKKPQRIREQRKNQISSWLNGKLLTRILPFIVLLIIICLEVLFLSCLITLLRKFLTNRITAISQATTQEHLKRVLLL